MENVPFIAIEGPIGVGKTSLASKLASYFKFQLLKEIVEENPFLDKFYDNIEEWSFQTEMFFLCNRYKQLEDIERKYLENGKPVIADYHILKNIIFARRTLQMDKLKKYEQIYKILTKDVAIPNVMIYIHASLDTLLNRIEYRGRDIEHNIQPEYLMQLSKDYDDYMDHFETLHPHVPLIRINGDETDFVTHQKDLLDIIERVKSKLNNIKRSKPDEFKRKV